MTISEYITTLLSPVRWVLQAYVSESAPESKQAWEHYSAETSAAGSVDGVHPLQKLQVIAELDEFSYFLLKLTLAVELLPSVRAAAESLGGVSVPLALRLYSATEGEAVFWQAAWRANEAARLLFDEANGAITPKRIVVDFVLGVMHAPHNCELFRQNDPLTEPLTDGEIPSQIARRLEFKPNGNIFCICGTKGAGRKYWLKRYAQERGGTLLFLRYNDISDEQARLDDIKLSLSLSGAVLCVYGLPEDKPEKLPDFIRKVKPANAAIICEEPIAAQDGYSHIVLTVPPLEFNERLKIWQNCLESDIDIANFARRYKFTVGQIINACNAAQNGTPVTPETLNAACRQQLSHELEKTAQKTQLCYSWNDLILPQEQTALLRHICARVTHAETVYNEWKIGGGATSGNGVRALFSGKPGTGKTMAAQVIAQELGMEMFTINLSSLVSKYIGETEKNLETVFTEAEKSGGILFFDEADAIFGKRGEQKDSRDKYANLQTSFLLQRLETYGGVIILASNLLSNFDPAFLRRISVRVEFPAPDEELRRQLWQKYLNNHAPLSPELDTKFLAARFDITGSAIKNIATTAAFIAAANNNAISMSEILQAASMEYAKSDKVLAHKESMEFV